MGNKYYYSNLIKNTGKKNNVRIFASFKFSSPELKLTEATCELISVNTCYLFVHLTVKVFQCKFLL